MPQQITIALPTKEEELRNLMLNGMFIGFIGETGCGKTTSLTWFLYHLNNIAVKSPEIKIYTNYHLNDIEDLTWDWEFMHHPDELLDLPKFSIVGLDDMWRWCLDSYKTMSKIMTKYDEIQASGRKRGYMILASLQRFMRADPNFRMNIQYVIKPAMFFDAYSRPFRINIAIINNHDGAIEGMFDIDPNPVFDMFSTSEEITPFDKQEHHNFDKISKDFVKWNIQEMEDSTGKMIKVQRKINQDTVNLFLVECNLYAYMTKDERGMLKTKIKRLIE